MFYNNFMFPTIIESFHVDFIYVFHNYNHSRQITVLSRTL